MTFSLQVVIKNVASLFIKDLDQLGIPMDTKTNVKNGVIPR